MLSEIFEKLDFWIVEHNIQASREGLPAISKCEFRIVGQTALLEANLKIDLASTVDVDAMNNAAYSVTAKFNELLNAHGLEYDKLSNEIWMPAETIYADLFRGISVVATRAEPEFVMLSKAKKAPTKNKVLLRQYLAASPPKRFFDLCQKYEIDLEEVLKD